MEWGDEIEVCGVRPDWLRDGELMQYQTSSRTKFHDMKWGWGWAVVGGAIRLPATHSYYQVARYNAEHGTSFVYWPGGDSAPAGVDEGADVLLRGGNIGGAYNWVHSGGSRDIIGYTPRQPTTSNTETVTLRKMSEAEATELSDRLGYTFQSGFGFREACRHFGLIRTPTRAETIAAKSGVAVDVVERVLGAMGDE